MTLSLAPLRALALGALLSLTACGGAGSGADGTTIKVADHVSKERCENAAAINVADQLHALKSSLDVAGEATPTDYTIEWANFIGGPPIIAAQIGGSIDVGWMAETPLIFAQAAGSPVKVVAVSQSAKEGGSAYALVVKPNSPIRTAADLKGRSVTFMKGTVLHYFIANLLDQQGLSLKDITQVQATSFGTGLLDKDAADAIILTEPFLTELEAAGKIRVIATGADYTPGFNYLVASEAALADPAKAKAIGAAAPALAKQYHVSVATAEKIIERSPSRYTPIDADVIAKHQAEADLFLKEGLIRKKLDVGSIFDKRYNAIAAAQETAK